jgi:MbtH protein
VDRVQGYRVVVNDDEQYSLLPAGVVNPLGWHDAGKTGSEEDCLSFIRERWTDMRPASLRRPTSACEDRCTTQEA